MPTPLNEQLQKDRKRLNTQGAPIANAAANPAQARGGVAMPTGAPQRGTGQRNAKMAQRPVFQSRNAGGAGAGGQMPGGGQIPQAGGQINLPRQGVTPTTGADPAQGITSYAQPGSAGPDSSLFSGSTTLAETHGDPGPGRFGDGGSLTPSPGQSAFFPDEGDPGRFGDGGPLTMMDSHTSLMPGSGVGADAAAPGPDNVHDAVTQGLLDLIANQQASTAEQEALIAQQAEQQLGAALADADAQFGAMGFLGGGAQAAYEGDARRQSAMDVAAAQIDARRQADRDLMETLLGAGEIDIDQQGLNFENRAFDEYKMFLEKILNPQEEGSGGEPPPPFVPPWQMPENQEDRIGLFGVLPPPVDDPNGNNFGLPENEEDRMGLLGLLPPPTDEPPPPPPEGAPDLRMHPEGGDDLALQYLLKLLRGEA